MRTLAPGGIATDFASRSLVMTPHPAYMEAIGKTMKAFMDPERRSGGSTAEKIAEEAYAAVTDTSDRVTFVAGDDARATYGQRLAAGVEAFRKGIRERFLG